MPILESLQSLKLAQLKTLVKNAKDAVGLSITGRTKKSLVESLYNLHTDKKYNGKSLLGYSDKAHLMLPKRAKIDREGIQKKRDAEAQLISNMKKEKEAKALGQTPAGKYMKLMRDIKSATSMGQIEAIKAKMRKLKQK